MALPPFLFLLLLFIYLHKFDARVERIVEAEEQKKVFFHGEKLSQLDSEEILSNQEDERQGKDLKVSYLADVDLSVLVVVICLHKTLPKKKKK